jgi:hypothetical protein
MKKGLQGIIVPVNELSGAMKKQMYELFITYFVVSERLFMDDLEKKDSVLLLRDEETDAVKGFSTMKMLRMKVATSSIKALFSGDTIIDTLYRSETELIKHIGRFVYGRIEDKVKFYWFLISMGFRTYRFLPIFFHDYYPRFDKDTPSFEQKVMDALAIHEFGECYQRERGIIVPERKNYLKETYASIPARRLSNPHIEFFFRKNPGFAQGEELVCLAEISKDNFKPVFYRITKCSR